MSSELENNPETSGSASASLPSTTIVIPLVPASTSVKASGSVIHAGEAGVLFNSSMAFQSLSQAFQNFSRTSNENSIVYKKMASIMRNQSPGYVFTNNGTLILSGSNVASPKTPSTTSYWVTTMRRIASRIPYVTSMAACWVWFVAGWTEANRSTYTPRVLTCINCSSVITKQRTAKSRLSWWKVLWTLWRSTTPESSPWPSSGATCQRCKQASSAVSNRSGWYALSTTTKPGQTFSAMSGSVTISVD